MADGFFRLRHDAVVGGHDQHRDIGDIGAAGPHLGEGFVPWRIDERDGAVSAAHLVGPNVLGNAAGLALDDLGAHDAVQQ